MATSSRPRQPKNAKSKEEPGKKPPPLHFMTSTADYSESDILKTMLMTQKGNWMQDFTLEQQHMISQEFGKMMKTLKRKLVSPQKAQQSQQAKAEAKTQRLQPDGTSNPAQNTARKNACTDRRPGALKSPKRKNTIKYQVQTKPHSHNRLKSPGVLENKLKQKRVQAVKSPKKAKKQVKYSQTSNVSSKQQKPKPQKMGRSQMVGTEQENYFLCGDSFVGVGEREFKLLESEIALQQSRLDNKEQQFVWEQFLEQKQKLSKQRIFSLEQTQSKKLLSLNDIGGDLKTSGKDSSTREESAIISRKEINLEDRRVQGRLQVSKQANMQIFEEFYAGALTSQLNQQVRQYLLPEDQTNNQYIQNSQIVQYEQNTSQVQLAVPQDNSQGSHQQSSIRASINAINSQLRINKQLLEKLHRSGKISQQQFQHHMDLIIEHYDQQMTQIESLKQAMDRNRLKTDLLLKSTKQSLNISSRIDEVDPLNFLEALVRDRNAISSSENLDDNLPDSEQDLHGSRQAQNQQMSQQNSAGQNILEEIDNEEQSKQVGSFSQFTKELQQLRVSMKPHIEARIAYQMGMVAAPAQGIRTSVVAVFQFLKLFFNYIKTHHLEQFLAYMNMPYGYSVEQRLRYMQGYDDEDQQQPTGEVIFGIEEVIRPEILQQFHQRVYFKHYSQAEGLQRQCQKLHQRAILDAINEAVNRYRPYFIIHGEPYSWTACEKALTHYKLHEGCVDEILQKVQLDVLKCSSALCGLIVPEAVRGLPSASEQALNIQQIFEKYTAETECQLLEHRQSKVMKQQKIEAEQTNFQWQFFDEFRTAILYQVSSSILQQLAQEVAEQAYSSRARLYVQELYEECGLDDAQGQTYQF